VLVLPVSGVSGLVEVLRAFDPQIVVVAGSAADDDMVARWAYRVRSAAGALQLTLFRRGRVDRARTAARQLSESAGDAHRQLLDLLDGSSRTVPPVSESKPAMVPRRRRANA
jgi:MerR family transcriptional regulator, light-induced transcriptional regulator